MQTWQGWLESKDLRIVWSSPGDVESTNKNLKDEWDFMNCHAKPCCLGWRSAGSPCAKAFMEKITSPLGDVGGCHSVNEPFKSSQTSHASMHMCWWLQCVYIDMFDMFESVHQGIHRCLVDMDQLDPIGEIRLWQLTGTDPPSDTFATPTTNNNQVVFYWMQYANVISLFWGHYIVPWTCIRTGSRGPIWLKGTIALKQIGIAFGGAKPFRNAVLTANTQ